MFLFLESAFSFGWEFNIWGVINFGLLPSALNLINHPSYWPVYIVEQPFNLLKHAYLQLATAKLAVSYSYVHPPPDYFFNIFFSLNLFYMGFDNVYKITGVWEYCVHSGASLCTPVRKRNLQIPGNFFIIFQYCFCRPISQDIPNWRKKILTSLKRSANFLFRDGSGYFSSFLVPEIFRFKDFL